MLQILQFANRSDLLADACFSSYTGFPPTLHSNTSAQTALGLSQHGCIIHSLDVKPFVARYPKTRSNGVVSNPTVKRCGGRSGYYRYL